MLTYNIHLKTVNEFRIYVNMYVRFHIAGYVIAGEEKINMYDILDILENGPVEELLLVLTQYRMEEIKELEEYMEKTGILNESQAKTLKSA